MEWAAFEAAHSRPAPQTFRVRGGRVCPSVLVEALNAQGFEIRPAPCLPEHYHVFQVDSAPFPLSETLEHWLGLFYIQQSATCLAAPLLDPQPGEHVLDLCAAPGGKTTHLAEWMGDSGTVVAADTSEARLQALAGNLSRLAHPGVLSVAGDALALPEDVTYARILADVPCSGEGRLRQTPRRRGASRGDLNRLPSLQEALLRKALRLLAPGGRLLYVTCTLAPEENEGVLSRILEDPQDGEPPIRLVPLQPDLPHAQGVVHFGGVAYHPDVEGTCRIHPHHLNSGGLFLALLEHREPLEAPRGWGPAPQDAGPYALEGTDLSWAGHYTPARVHRLGAWPEAGWHLDGRARTTENTRSTSSRKRRRQAPSTRVVRAGLRGIEEGAGLTVLPTPDVMRWLPQPPSGIASVDLNQDAWIRLLDGSQVLTNSEQLDREGGVLLMLHDVVLGTGTARKGRLFPRLPEARARWLRQALVRRDPTLPLPRREPID